MDTHKGLMEDILKKLPPLENSLVAWAVLMPEQWGSRPVHIYWDKDVAQRKADSFFDDSQTMQDAVTFNMEVFGRSVGPAQVVQVIIDPLLLLAMEWSTDDEHQDT